ncbi:endonuclease domain-containing protein [Psychroserpens sp.]|uniref:endonuclease domain-containing protein n=1 Tax=Psychroserpens sp. TaxID=2020870 RepID=UPI001B002243|nr:endonuclease domain-containing protein [Psychroserpens sp.]MBO6607528.1 endonuclease domain-containing protein [Psychroserpens sp.]MBO6655188.1 endonuclease domain-containing protein [Psychroserpens sp.]MBO6683222.1 endonuclease domain-containing protein [Psychroserpens sp.]MBO6749786.1 endonuclease domain-containing protein [Psychroserpens sp.]MBO6916710.1 endonuclease domain-containing protein [Psychroserpens sp.]
MRIHNYKVLKDKRRALRKNQTPAEAQLWKYLRGRQLQGRKFRRQHSIMYFIVDFYCPQEQLIIELDGEYHNDILQQAYDAKRTCLLQKHGFKVIRFENKDVFESIENVLLEIISAFKSS